MTMCRFRYLAAWTLLAASLIGDGLVSAAEDASQAAIMLEAKGPAMRMMQTPNGTRFGLFGEKPGTPAPTLFIFATGIDEMGSDGARIYSATGREVAQAGWIYVAVDPPCHGYDRQEGEPGGLAGWAHRIQAGQDLLGPFVRRGTEVLDYLIAEKYSDPDRIAASGTSRGGFCALHFAAAERRVRAVTTVSPVTDPLALTEFAGVTRAQVRGIDGDSLVDRLAGRAVWLSMGNDDARVDTDACVTLARKLVRANRRLKPELKVVPVELLVGPSLGHYEIDNAYPLAAAFLLKQVRSDRP